jgi:hypothetical protein
MLKNWGRQMRILISLTALLALTLSMITFEQASAQGGKHCGPKNPNCNYGSQGERHGGRTNNGH